jgi:hypothetical protein
LILFYILLRAVIYYIQMEGPWIRALIGMEVKEARKMALKKGVPRGIMDVREIPVMDNKAKEWLDGNFNRTVRIQYNEKTGRVVNARIG